jgi:hypothetical protein
MPSKEIARPASAEEWSLLLPLHASHSNDCRAQVPLSDDDVARFTTVAPGSKGLIGGGLGPGGWEMESLWTSRHSSPFTGCGPCTFVGRFAGTRPSQNLGAEALFHVGMEWICVGVRTATSTTSGYYVVGTTCGRKLSFCGSQCLRTTKTII